MVSAWRLELCKSTGKHEEVPTVKALGFCNCLGLSFELFVEWFVVEKGPGVIKLVIPPSFQGLSLIEPYRPPRCSALEIIA